MTQTHSQDLTLGFWTSLTAKWHGIVVSRSRMKEIELVVNPLGGPRIDSLNSISEMLPLGTVGSINLLVHW